MKVTSLGCRLWSEVVSVSTRHFSPTTDAAITVMTVVTLPPALLYSAWLSCFFFPLLIFLNCHYVLSSFGSVYYPARLTPHSPSVLSFYGPCAQSRQLGCPGIFFFGPHAAKLKDARATWTFFNFHLLKWWKSSSKYIRILFVCTTLEWRDHCKVIC